MKTFTVVIYFSSSPVVLPRQGCVVNLRGVGRNHNNLYVICPPPTVVWPRQFLFVLFVKSRGAGTKVHNHGKDKYRPCDNTSTKHNIYKRN